MSYNSSMRTSGQQQFHYTRRLRLLASKFSRSVSPENRNLTETADNRKNMPDVTGKSLRAGLQVLQHFNVDIKLLGSGRIVSQQPAAGAELKKGTECILKMQQTI